MSKKDEKIKVDQVMATITDTLNDLRNDIEKGHFDRDEWSEIKSGLEEAEYTAYVVKIAPYMKDVMHASPGIPVRDLVIQMLAHVRPETSPNVLKKITDYILETWKEVKLKEVA